MTMRKLAISSVGAALVLAAGTSPPPRDGGERPAPPAGQAPAAPAPGGASSGDAAETDTARIARLEREARALAKAGECAASGRCRTAPVGSRPCGGPRTYIVYCATATDSAALFAKLAELARAEEEYNRKAGLASTCEYRMPPGVEVSGGACRATAGSPGPDAPR